MKFKLDYLAVQAKALEDLGITESQVSALEYFDRNEDKFDEVFESLPQRSQYNRRKERREYPRARVPQPTRAGC